MSFYADRFLTIKESIFARMTRAAIEKNAINLAQGFPDFAGPHELIDRMHFYLDNTVHQYTRASGHLKLCKALSDYSSRFLPRTYNELDEITVVNGATEGIFCTILGLVNPGQHVVVFEPFYESYATCTLMAGARLVGIPLEKPSDQKDYERGHWAIDWSQFDAAMKGDVGLIMLNHPHNPTGKVFTVDELTRIASRAREKGIPVAIDGVYEHLVYSPNDTGFVRFLEQFGENTIFISSIAKTLSFTGFKVGFVFAPKSCMHGIRAAHEAAVFCQPPHIQLAVADILSNHAFLTDYVSHARDEFTVRRNTMRSMLVEFGFYVPNAQGSYFLMAQKHQAPIHASFDEDMANEILDRFGVAFLPVSSFFAQEPSLKDWLRVAFCKQETTILEARTRLLNKRNP